MKKTLIYLSILFIAIACGSETKEEPKESNSKDVKAEIAVETTDAKPEVMDPRTQGGAKSETQKFIDEHLLSSTGEFGELGYWVGAFGGNVINISLYEIVDGIAHGYSVCAGNFRKIEGSVKKEDDVLVFDMKEPGDDKYDGHFEFQIDITGQSLSGKWSPFDEGVTDPKEYNLSKRVYSYDSTVGDYPEASTRELTYDDVENMTGEELSEMRNEIYARHGYSFSNKEWRFHFEAKDWYMPLDVDVREKLTDVEVTNIELIYEYEMYYDEYYNDYGR